MHDEAIPAAGGVMPTPTVRTRARRGLRFLAVLLNFLLFGTGLYFQAHPRDRLDLWSAGGVVAVAIVNSAALTVPRGAVGGHLVARLQRIALFANALLLGTACVVVVLSAYRDWHHAVLHGVMLVVPPLLTIVALRRLPHG